MDLRLHGRGALITGASRGIGRATAEAFAEEGCDLVLTARDAVLLDAEAARLSATYHVDVRTFPADLRDVDVSTLAAAASDADIIVNNAGDVPNGTLDAVDDQAWRAAWDLKVFGYISLARRMYQQFKDAGGGVIINTMGVSGERPDANFVAGSAANAALMAFTAALGGASMRDNIRVVGVNPGPVETERIVKLMRSYAESLLGDADRYKELMQQFPQGRAARPREIADMIVFLASDRCAYVSGTVVTVDGGMSARPA
jgi:NAD(P)-dependent dehydrogenase (short-subunit alcohol dehydrogenase family)